MSSAGRVQIRQADPADAPVLAWIESICFPPAEAAGPEQTAARLAAFPECFLEAVCGGEIIGFINGCCTMQPELPDILYADAGLHRPDGPWQTVFGLDVLPDFRRQGTGRLLLDSLTSLARARGKAGLVLTCKDHLVSWYSRAGFVCRGRSASTHGGAVWNDMILDFAAL